LMLMIRQNVTRSGPTQELSIPLSEAESISRDSIPPHKRIHQPLASAGFSAGMESISDGRTVEMTNHYCSYDSPFVKQPNIQVDDARSVVSCSRSHHVQEFRDRTAVGHGDVVAHRDDRRRELTPEQNRTGRQLRMNADGSLYATQHSKGFSLEEKSDYQYPAPPPAKPSDVLPNGGGHWNNPLPGPPVSKSQTPFATDLADPQHKKAPRQHVKRSSLPPWASDADDLDQYRVSINHRSFNDRAGPCPVDR